MWSIRLHFLYFICITIGALSVMFHFVYVFRQIYPSYSSQPAVDENLVFDTNSFSYKKVHLTHALNILILCHPKDMTESEQPLDVIALNNVHVIEKFIQLLFHLNVEINVDMCWTEDFKQIFFSSCIRF